MAASLYSTATEYIANAITLTRGKSTDIASVGIYTNTNPNTVPTVGQFTATTYVDGTQLPLPALGVTGELDVLSLIGPGGQVTGLTTGSYQVWILIVTATENIIRKVDTLTIL